MKTRMRLGEFLVNKNIIAHDDLSRALKYQENWGGRLGEALINLNILTEDKLLAALKYHLGLPVINLEQVAIPPDIIRLISKETVKKYKAVPVKMGEVSGKKALFVAMSNPLDLTAVEEIQFAAGLKVQPVLSREKGLMYAMRHFYDIDVGFITTRGEDIPTDARDEAMTIIRAGEEVRIENTPKAEKEDLVGAVIDKRKSEETPSPADQSEKKVLQALIKLLIEKGLISLEELKEKLSAK